MSKSKYKFTLAPELEGLIAGYFKYIEGEYHEEEKPGKTARSKPIKQKVYDREPEPPTFAGLALFLGFSTRQQLETYEAKGRHSALLKTARLRIEAAYEKKLHSQSASSGAIFALKSMGWNERTDTDEPGNITLKIEIIQTGPQLASAENEVIL
jgi:hypothetical protein